MEHKGTIRIETDRLVLKRHVLDDAEIMFKNWVTEKDVTKFLSWQPHKNVDETKQLLIDWIESYDKQDFYFWTIELKDSHELVGDISVVSLDEATESVELGYGIGSRWWGKGITAEAGRALVKFFFEEVKVKRVYANAIKNGATSVLEPELEPWGQRTCYIADPEGNLIEIGSWNKVYEQKDL